MTSEHAAAAWAEWDRTRDPAEPVTREQMQAELPPGWVWAGNRACREEEAEHVYIEWLAKLRV